MSGAGPGRLFVCPTPIGNLEDVSLRAIRVLGEVDLIVSEDTRRTRILLDRHGIDSRPRALHDRNERSAVPAVLARIEAGESVALVSDAGTPVVSDPGYLLIRACVEEGFPVEVLPGPTAVTTALVASALPADSFRFVGFLPRRPGDLRKLLDAASETLVAFESPHRLAAALAVLATIDPERRVAVCRELSKLHEEVVRGSAAELAERYSGATVKGEITIVVAPGESPVGDLRSASAAVAELVACGARPRAAAKVVASLTGTRANDLYRALEDGARSPDPTGPAESGAGGD